MASLTVELSNLDGQNGFRLDGVSALSYSGRAVASAGDVDGDGFDDLIIGAYGAQPNGQLSGSSYVVFGHAGAFASVVQLSSLNGTNGIRLDAGETYGRAGYSVASAGDVNGDGFDDMIVGAKYTGTEGASYVVFGKAAGLASHFALSDLNGTNGFRLNGDFGDASGNSVASAGDFNRDGFDDIIVGAARSGTNNSLFGAAYVVFGKTGPFASVIDLGDLNGKDGFLLDGLNRYDFTGASVASAGDVNGDGFGDILVGAPGASPHGQSSGSTYVIFGRGDINRDSISLFLDADEGFRIDGVASTDISGSAVASAGDINKDGFDDLVIGAPGADPHGASSGTSYVILGKPSGFGSVFDLSTLNGKNGFVIQGAALSDQSSFSVASAGDVNGDGFFDLIIGAPYASPNGSESGSSYLIFGKTTGFAPVIELSALDGADGVRINGVASKDHSGMSVASAGDINKDGFDDLMIGAHSADPHGESSGSTYVLFGRENFGQSNTKPGTPGPDKLTGSKFADRLEGLAGNDTLDGGIGADTLNGGTGIDSADYRTSGAISINLASGVTKLAAAGDVLISCEQILGSATGNDSIIGSAIAESFLGFGGRDTLDGGQGNDSLDGGVGADTLKGGPGNDLFIIDNIGDKTTEAAGAGIDLVQSTVSFAVSFGVDNLTLIGAAAINGTGNSLANAIIGNKATNKLDGGTGADTLTGGLGSDILTGGANADRFDYNVIKESGTTAATRDHIVGFAINSDRIDLSTIDAVPGGANNAFVFKGTTAFTAAGQIHLTQSGDDTIVEVNTIGKSGAELTILLSGITASTMDALDFLV